MPDLTRSRRLLVLAICCSSLFIVGLDTTIVNLALPSIRRDLGSSLSGLQWVIDAYTLVLASLLMLGGSTGDWIGRRRTFQIGLLLFGAGSLLCSLAPTTGWLIAFRAVQAVGGSMLNPVAMSIITNVFTDRAERARAIGVWGSYLQDVRGYSPLHAGLLTLPMAAMTALLPVVSGRMVANRGTRLPLVIGGTGIAASGVLLLTLHADTPLPLVVAAYVVFGVGFGMINAPITNTAVSGMPVAQAGVAAGVASTSRQVGSALGVAVLGSLVTAQLGASGTAGFAAAAQPAWFVVIGCGLVVLALGLVSTTARARETARRTAERFAVPVATSAAAPAR